MRSCKRRGFCPSCLGRRMADTAIHLERAVLPAVPIRHWICSLPWGLRALLGYDRKLCSEVLSAFVGEMFRSLRRRAKRRLGLASVAGAYPGAVAAVHRADGALRLNVHFHVLGLDGVYVRDDLAGALVFHPLPAPTQAEVVDVARRTAARIERILRKHGRSLDPELANDDPHPVDLDDPAVAACYAAAARGVGITGDRAGQPTLRLIFPEDVPDRIAGPPEFDEPVAEVRGVNVHAKQMIDGRDRVRVKRLCCYVTRPPLAQDRLTRRSDRCADEPRAQPSAALRASWGRGAAWWHRGRFALLPAGRRPWSRPRAAVPYLRQ
ncbi:MAG: transposase zinc-binding domain-containing protein [Polyangiaceae bacterium]|nr:transposase zinc-binding domain-containing protein [Polyangiaceae bacterium]